jgi:cation diffusion facilitator family transporter
MIVLAALVILGEAVLDIWRIHRGTETLHRGALDYGLLLILVAMLVHGVLGIYLVRSGRQHQSMTLEADGWHLLTDSLTSATVLVALLIVRFTGWAYADPIGALAIGAYITATGWHLIRRAAAGLMDEQDIADQKLLIDLLDAHVAGKTEPKICSYHKLRHRHSGRYHWVDFHLIVPGWWDVDRGHRVASTIEYEIEQALGQGNATAHVEPCKDTPCPTCSPVK